MRAFEILKKAISGILYPEGVTCALCGNGLSESSRYGLCPDCSVPFIVQRCEKCGTALMQNGRKYCDRCVGGKDGHEFVMARAPFPYARDCVKRLVWKLKYYNSPYCAKLMAEPMAELLRSLGWNADVIAYVPMHPKKLAKRRYNQSKLLAGHLSDLTGIPVAGALIKTTYAKQSAASLGREDRRKLLDNTFAPSGGESLKGKTVLLVDDVFTTGATADECAKALKAGKAKAVYVLTYATSIGDKTVTYEPDDEKGIRRLMRMRGS